MKITRESTEVTTPQFTQTDDKDALLREFLTMAQTELRRHPNSQDCKLRVSRITAALAEKPVTEAAGRPEPVAWMNPKNGVVVDAKKKRQLGEGDGYPNFSVALVPLTYADRVAAERDVAESRADFYLKEQVAASGRAETADRQLASLQVQHDAELRHSESVRKQLAELQRKHEGLVARLREPSEEMISEGKLAAAKTSDVVSVMRAMSAVALREGEE